MIKFSRRYWYVGALIGGLILLSVFYDILPLLLQYYSLTQQQLAKSAALQRYKKVSQVSNVKNKLESPPKTLLMILDEFILLIRQSGLTLQSIHPEKNDTTNKFIVETSLQGDFSQFVVLLNLLDESELMVIVEHSQMKMLEKQLQIHLSVSLHEKMKSLPQRHQELLNAANPFCLNENGITWPPVSDDAALAKIQVSQIKMIGYLQNNNLPTAWLLLPDGHVVSVGIGQLIGSERALIVSINRARMTLKLSNKKTITLTI